MASSRRRSKTAASSIKYNWIPLEVSEIDTVTRRDEQKDKKDGVLRKECHSAEAHTLLSTTELASVIGTVWKAVGHPSAVCQPQGGRKKEVGNIGLRCVGSGEDRDGSLTTKSDYERVRKMRKMLLFDSCYGLDFANLLLGRNVEDVCSSISNETGRRNWVENAEVRGGFVDVYRTLNEKYFLGLRDTTSISRYEEKRKARCCSFENSGACPAEQLIIGSEKSSFVSDEIGGSSCEHPLRSPCAVEPTINGLAPSTVSRSSGLFLGHDIEILHQSDKTIGYYEKPHDSCVQSSRAEYISEDCIDVNDRVPPIDVASIEDKDPSSTWMIQDKLGVAIGKKKHALAGAFAGTCVSICLHPIDTVKTVIQAHSVHQTAIFRTFESVISERGLRGLYRGIATNLASSAPTSAIYTSTYEIVKAAILPVLPKEYHSVAHCTAGGCASIATSFIFTPSECIKQQMQVRTHYQNCWSALIGILEKGGLSSLYAGWGAVLCRNIPHSMIKFYTYESLKTLFLPFSQPDARLSTLETLFCGGLAGSTAALFTTPFDVVKTRLQTQVPGSLTQYDGVFHALQQITKHEGLRGLYRGLIPRLAMYVSQGAIFFASYEFFKTVLSLDTSNLQTEVVADESNSMDKSNSDEQAKLHCYPQRTCNRCTT